MKNNLSPDFIPCRQTKGSVGYDIYAVEDMTIEPWYKTYDTGVCFTGEECPVTEVEHCGLDTDDEIYPKEWVALIVPRSSMGFKHGLHFANTICVIDKDYRDTIKIMMKAEHSFNISKGERYAQMLFIPHCILLDEIEPVNERSGGIGSTN